MSSHREAPEISKDPVADNADVYAFVSPDAPNTVTILTNFVPLQDPPGGPNFFEFGDDVVYSIYIDNDGDGIPEIAYQFSFETQLRNPDTFLYNTGQISSLDSPNWNKRQFYSVTRVDGPDTTAYGTASANGGLTTTVLAEGLASPPCNIGPRSTPDYPQLAKTRSEEHTAELPSLPTRGSSDLHGLGQRGTHDDGARRGSRVAALQHWSAFDARLPAAGESEIGRAHG